MQARTHAPKTACLLNTNLGVAENGKRRVVVGEEQNNRNEGSMIRR
jgi:hypothetical protein